MSATPRLDRSGGTPAPEAFRGSVGLLEADERPTREGPSGPLPAEALAREIRAMNARIARRRALVPSSAEVPVDGPRWCSRVLDLGDEVVAIHRDTGSPYPLELFRDLDPEASAAIVARRLAERGFDAEAIGAVLEALGIPPRSRGRILRALGGEA